MKHMKFYLCVLAAAALAGAGVRADDTASISGKVTFDGTPPKMKKITVDADPKCAEMHADEPLRLEEVIVNPNSTLKNVFVYVKSGLGDKTYDVPTTPVELDQTGCHYVPHVFGMMAHQHLKIVNKDDTLHNIHAMPTKNAEFNVGQPNQGMETMKTFANPEVMVHFKCDIHPWMSAYVGVVDNPFYFVTGDDGTYSLKGLPAGTYVIEAWQEKYGTQDTTVTVAAGEAKTADFTYKAP
jgi:hypothetical protein